MPGEGGWPAGAALLRNACGQGGPVGARGLLLSYRHNGHSRHQATGRSPFSVGGCGRMGPWRPHPPSLLPSTPRMQRRTGGPARQDTVLPPPHARPTPTPAAVPSETQTLTGAPRQRAAPEGSCSSGHPALPVGYFLLPWPPSSQLPGWSPKSKSMALNGPGQEGRLGRTPVLWCLSLGPSPRAQPPTWSPAGPAGSAWSPAPHWPCAAWPVFLGQDEGLCSVHPQAPVPSSVEGLLRSSGPSATSWQPGRGSAVALPPHRQWVTKLLVQVTRPLPS